MIENEITRAIVTCPFCGAQSYVFASQAGIAAWKNGELIQNALPELSPQDRELIKTGICCSCWPSNTEGY